MDEFGDFTTAGSVFSNNSEASKEPAGTLWNTNTTTGAPNTQAFSDFQSTVATQSGGGKEGNDTRNITEFAQFSSIGENFHVAGGVPFEIPPLPNSPLGDDIHVAGGVPFEIPPLPYSLPGDDVHVGGGVSFEIPPLSDFSFDNPMEDLNLVPESSKRSSNEPVMTTSGTNHENVPQSQVTVQEQKFDFSNFNPNFKVPENESMTLFGSNVADDKATGNDNEFGEFSTGTKSKENGGGLMTTGSEDFGEFGGFSGNTVTTTAAGDDFGGFATVATTTGGDDFGAFSGEFGGFATVSATTAIGGDEFGDFTTVSTTAGGREFGGFSGNLAAPATTKSVPDDNDFGEFSGNFGFTGGNVGKETPVPQTSSASSITLQKLGKTSVDTLKRCFIEVASMSEAHTTRAHTFITLSKCLLRTHPKQYKTDNTAVISLWLVLQNCIDFTIPLHKFNDSYLQSCYYASISVDPVLVSRPSTLSILTGMTKFEAPLGGTTAVEDLRESFGFEGELSELGSPSENVTSPFRRKSEEHTPALLDLSLPLSPNSPTRDSFTLTADLAGLDLNPQPKSEKLTSIQQLLLNERLVINRSTWMDSQLAELGGGGGRDGSGQEEQSNSQPDTPRSATKKGQNSVEFQLQQLGLDASKTTMPKGSEAELSLTARTVLGRLPELSFMLLTNKLENSAHYSRGNP